jgi:hypothetical protein
MKTIFLVFIMVCSIHFSYAQKGKLLSPDDPLVAGSGLWQYAGEKEIDLGDPHAEEEDLEEEGMDGVPSFGMGIPVEFVGLIPENSKKSMFAAFLDPDYGFACPNYFTAHKTKKTIEGKFLSTCAVELEGTTFSIRYKYKKKKDTLYLQYKGKWHPYKRYIFK